MTDLANRRGSVTERDYVPSSEQGIFAWTIFDPGATLSPAPSLPLHGQRDRDRMLTATLDLEDMWASAVNKAVTKIAVRGYEISDNDDSTRRTEYGKSLVVNLDGPAEYRSGISKVVQDFLLTDNGWFVEVKRAGNKSAGKVEALYHLDSFRCYRTGNLDHPVVYLDYDGIWHKLATHQVIFGSDMPSPRARMFNKGRCAASRAFQTVIKLSAMDVYFTEKITGSRALALHFVTGVSKQQLLDAMETSEAEKARKGHVIYKGAVMIPVQTDQAINIASIDLASVPDGFDVEQVQKDGYKKYALAIGLNPDELVERAAGLNSGQSAQVAENAAEEAGGLPFFVKDIEDKLNYLVMPKQTIFQVTTNDTRDKQAKAALDKTRADTIAVMRGTAQAPGWITDEMALQLSVDEHLLPPEFLPQDVTPAGQLTDSGDGSKTPSPTPRAPYAGQVTPPPPAAPQAMKEAPIVIEPHVTINMPEQHPVQVHAYMPEQKAAPVYVAPADVHVSTPDVTVNVPAQGVPIVNVAQPEITVQIPEQAIPVVNVTSPDVIVNVPPMIVEKAADPDEWEEAVKWASDASEP